MIKLLFKLKAVLVPVMIVLISSSSALGAFSSDVSTGGKGSNSLSKTNADYIFLNFNNFNMPVDNKGVIAEVNSLGGRMDGNIFLFSGGFFLSGFSGTKQWGNGVMSASRIGDYVAGPVGSTSTDSKNRMYLVTALDPAFGPSWQDWKDAVAVGADFYDGDHDGIYNPVDKNQNGVWDLDEDRPDLVGDFSAWCVYNDGLAKALRRYTDVDPQGIEIRQTVFGFASKSVIGNMLFVRYRIFNTGLKADVLDSVYFAVACDPDLGDYKDDLVGCDTTLSCAYTYQTGSDAIWGSNPPCFMVDFFQGPVSYIPGVTFTDKNNNGVYDEGIDTPLKSATNVRGKVLGIDTIKGAMNLPLTSFTQYMQSHPTHGDPNTQYELRNYLIGGRGKDGTAVNPCTWAFGNKDNIAAICGTINPKFMYSGDPVKNSGWLNTTPQDQRQMSNTGPFKLEKNKPVDIVVAYLIGRGTSALNSVEVAKQNDVISQKIFDSNFPSPPPPPPLQVEAVTGDGFIDLNWATPKTFNYKIVDDVLGIDRRFHGYYVTAYSTPSKLAQINGVQNSAILAYYQKAYTPGDSIKAIYQVVNNGGIDLRVPEAPDNNKLDSATFANAETGRIKLRITKDPVTGGPLVKGKEYYFIVTNNTLNYRYIVNKNNKKFDMRAADYLDQSGSGVDEFESATIRVVYGTNMYEPAAVGNNGVCPIFTNGAFKYLVGDKSQLTGNNYKVNFFIDSAALAYSTYWKLTNTTTNKVLIDSSKVYNFDSTNYSGKIIEGILPRVKAVTPVMGSPIYTPDKNQWFKDFILAEGHGVFYCGNDLTTGNFLDPLNFNTRSKFTRADRIRKIEVRFGKPSKAYRYVHGYIGGLAAQTTAIYAKAIAASDTVGKGPIGKLGEGFVDVPYQVWVKDSRFSEERQLATAFCERRFDPKTTVFKGNPDGIWNPADSLKNTQEYIVVFDADYDPTGSQKVYCGGEFDTPSGKVTLYPDLRKAFNIPEGTVGISDRDRAIAASPWRNTLYVVGFQPLTASSKYTDGDVLTVPIMTYPYTAADQFTFSTNVKGTLTDDQQKDIFEKVTVFPNPLFAYNPATSYTVGSYPDDPFVTFSNLPTEVTIRIYTLSGTLVRELSQKDKADGLTAPFLRWNLKNESGLRVASGMYIARVISPKYGEKILKFGIVMPQKQIRNY